MSTEGNKTTLRRFFEELFNEGNLDVIGEIVAEDYVNHDPAPGEQPGLEGLKAFITGMRSSFPDGHFGIEDQIAEGDKA
ncbi:MAG: ester cyclase, partial [Anaerolineae bacterium]|nr:ester cyclase [Anaerolineae bacterium]